MPRTIQEQEINTLLGHIHLQRLKQITFPQVNHLERLIPSLLPVRTSLADFARFVLGSDNLAWFACESSVVCYRQCKVDGTNAKTSTSLSLFVNMYLPSMDEVEGGTDFNNIPCTRCQAVLIHVPTLFLIQSDELVPHKIVKTFSIDSFGGGYLFLGDGEFMEPIKQCMDVGRSNNGIYVWIRLVSAGGSSGKHGGFA